MPGVEVSEDFVCEHGMPKPWATCIECMSLHPDERPRPRVERPEPVAAPDPARPARKSPRAERAPRTSTPAVGRLPRSTTDSLPDLVGDKDLAYEIPPSDLRYFVTGTESTWLPISTMPRELRPDGSVYLQAGRDLVARARVRGIGFRERRWAHAAPAVASDLGPGATLELDGAWETVAVDLGPAGDAPVHGYRYVVVRSDGAVVVAPRE